MSSKKKADEEVVDAVVVEEVEAAAPPATEQGQAVAVVPAPPAAAQGGVMMPFKADEVREAMTAYQATVNATLDATDWQGTPGRPGSFVKKSGWRKIAKAFGLSVTRIGDGVERDADGEPVRAWAVYRATAPNGQAQDGDGYCSADESRFNSRGGRQKLENDLRATATTRAKNRAISDLVGMGEVSAEEVAQGGHAAPPPVVAFDGDLAPVWAVLEQAAGVDTTAAVRAWIVKDNGGVVPRAVGRALLAVGRVMGDRPEPGAAADDEVPEQPAAVAPDDDDDLPF
jgi:hypothetical protein